MWLQAEPMHVVYGRVCVCVCVTEREREKDVQAVKDD